MLQSPADPGLVSVCHRLDGVDLHAVEAGPADGPLVILLHGFPDFWWSWRRQVGPLAEQGYRVVAPDMRGYNLSDKPAGIAAYARDKLAADVARLADAYGRTGFRLVGHDWGGIVAWEAAIRFPERIEQLVVIDAPHPGVWLRGVARRPSQALRSAYVAFFQLPRLPEALLRANGYARLKRAMTSASSPGTWGPEELDRYAEAWRRPGALTAMLDYYRALRLAPGGAPARVRPPTLLLWGGRDPFLERALCRASLELCDDGRALVLDDAGHWPHLEAAQRVNDAIGRFFAGAPPEQATAVLAERRRPKMAVTLKPLAEQTIVITGASSGIGLVTARMAAKAGAKLVLAARSFDALDRLAGEIRDRGGQAVAVVADVSRQEDVREIARVATEMFGGFDTWVNNAGVSVYGTIEQVPLDDMRRLFDTNFWGVVYGSLEAVAHFKARGGRGGALINVGSVLSDRAVPLQGIYAASKHAVKGFTDTLRMELEKAGEPVSVTLIKPGPIDTPYPHTAKNYLEAEPTHVPPVYAPETVAKAILHAAETPTRDVFVGGAAKGIAALGNSAPRLTDKAMEIVFFEGSKSDLPPHPRGQNGLDGPSGTLEERGGYPGVTMETSLYAEAVLRPVAAVAAAAGTGLAAVAAWRAMRDGDNGARAWRRRPGGDR